MKNTLRFLVHILFFPALVFFVNYGIYKLTSWYETIWWSDVAMHFLGGWSIAYGASVVVAKAESAQLVQFKSGWLRSCIVVALVLSVAIFWEWYEYILDVIFQTQNQPSVGDTMLDFLMGFLGGICGVLLVEFVRHTHSHTVLMPKLLVDKPAQARGKISSNKKRVVPRTPNKKSVTAQTPPALSTKTTVGLNQ